MLALCIREAIASTATMVVALLGLTVVVLQLAQGVF
jgi:hypothetical protein